MSAHPFRSSLALLAIASLAHAHADPNEDLLVLRPDGVTIVVTLSISDADARSLREQLGSDGALGRWLEREAQRFVKLELDGAPAALTLQRSDRAARTISVTLAVEKKFARTVQFLDRRRDPRVSVPVRVQGAARARSLPPQPVVFDGHPLVIELR